jgi:rubrerythrin
MAKVSDETVRSQRKRLQAKGEIPVHEKTEGQDGKKRGVPKATSKHLEVATTGQLNSSVLEPADTAPDLTPDKFICPECQDVFTEQVWHCPVCVHHWPLEDDDHTRHITPT